MIQTITDPLASAMDGRRLLAVRGPNFSGRTKLLRDFCDANTHERGRIYIGPEVYNALSGLATSVRQEIELHAGAPLANSHNLAGLERFELTGHLEQNPGLLSGGEQACLAVLCGLALQPASIAIDCALEQLDSQRLASAISLLNDQSNPIHGTVVADNRLDEWNLEVTTAQIDDLRGAPAEASPVPPLAPEFIEKLNSISAPTIVLANVRAGYPKRGDVLKDLSVKLEPGKVHVLLGANGAGKSTCAKVLCGVLRPSGGEIQFDGQPSRPWKTPGRVVGYHLQNPDVGLFESSVAAELGKLPNAAHVLDAFGLRGVAGVNPLSLPFPVRKRVSLAATIACSQPWLFLDEPTLGADSATIAQLAQLVQLLAKKGHGVIVVSHSRAFRNMLGGTEWTIDQGRI
jgi:energy-coupling factor transport system ATP-binding protein